MFSVYCGWDGRQAEALEVFAWSVKRRASIQVKVFAVGTQKVAEYQQSESSLDGIEAVDGFVRMGATAFTYARFLVPWLCNFEGRALFADGADMLCLGDVAELACMDMRGRPVMVVKQPKSDRGRRPRVWTSFMLMDCGQLGHWVPGLVADVPDERLMRLGDFWDADIGELPEEWNALVQPGSEPPDGVKLAHWSALSDPAIGPWIEASGSRAWAGERDAWRAAHS